MIQILDEILLDPKQIPTVLALLDERYMPQTAARGLTLLQRWVSPPVAIPGEHNRLWLLWQVPDVWGYYGMRISAGTEVLEFWGFVDKVCEHRARHVLGSADQPLPSLEVQEDVA
ncbi:hypothetical protein [Pseudomonas sp. BN102]|uniref:hypothetical protein n=1 Tax=Pseudomonas sp. BN102 TaxID=2567886 RepID=UPI002454A884|nr:hypothetical protein [Pseudomonas sp. BN102]MDH4608467.1 hypothetical protein [Pseudomonas sp. BN102]